uniref:Secretory phospholipase A2 receptor-like n=1 Tax=Saccoglossus kowalevskii TaxID=10224 RepID=A0ABM0MZP5_SACKO|nr:PREDICTED: secretory phospholipase A2 receptor-like [Saccoglossus kowalevskii]
MCLLRLYVLVLAAYNARGYYYESGAPPSWYYDDSSSSDSDEDIYIIDIPFEGTFKFINEPKTWREASQYCRNDDGRIARITSQHMQDTVVDFIATMNSEPLGYWIDGRDKGTEGVWTYRDGTPMSYTAWAPYSPDGTGDCLVMSMEHSYKWTDETCSDKVFYVLCRYEGRGPTSCTNTIENNVDRKGSDINNGRYNVVGSQAECCQQCRSDPECLAWTFDKRPESYGQCWLKNEIPPQTRSFCCDSGTFVERIDK